jgi:hypothetical protein
MAGGQTAAETAGDRRRPSETCPGGAGTTSAKEEPRGVGAWHRSERGAWSRHKKIPAGPICDRPGCFAPPRSSVRTPARYCGDECRQALRRVRDRERKWKSRKTKAGRLKRRLEYEEARAKRRQRAATGCHGREGSPPAASHAAGQQAVGVYRDAAKTTLTSPYPQDHETPNHDPQTNTPSRPRAPPTC